MKGLELARAYWEELGRPAYEKNCPEVLEKASVGLVGEGSECFGFDDEISRDHDWGPGFIVLVAKETYDTIGNRLAAAYEALAAELTDKT